ncbi:MAG: ATP synthase F1 subunit delta [Thermoguttaceae bacterium]
MPSADITAEHARAAAEIAADVGVQQVADIYAAALLGATEKAGQTAAVLDEFDALLGEVFPQFPELEAILASTLVWHEEKAALLDRIFAGKVSDQFLDFLKVLSRHGRLDCLRMVRRQAQWQWDRLRGRVRVRLSTATAMDDAQADKLIENLRKLLGGEPVVQRDVDPALIGGAVVRVGDVVYDGSIANQLHNIRQQMIDRSADEIQSRRDRFRNSAGN